MLPDRRKKGDPVVLFLEGTIEEVVKVTVDDNGCTHRSYSVRLSTGEVVLVNEVDVYGNEQRGT